MSGPGDHQLALDLPAIRRPFSREGLKIAAPNEAAVAVAEAFIASGEPALAICGPAGSGKSHLLAVLAADCGVATYDAAEIEEARADRAGLVAIDRVEAVVDPSGLLTLIEERRARGLKLALAGRARPRDWARGLKDLETRLEAMVRASLEEPDEALLRAVIAQGFADRQWRAAERIADYAAPRIPRTFAAAHAFVEAAGAAAIEARGPLNLAVARKVIDALFAEKPTA